ncbi:MAG: ABC transporter ATP-binding protein [Pyrinomonadaceae bacterium]
MKLIVNDLRKAFRSPSGALIEVLRGVSFSVEAGEVVAIMGASGAGKSTLLHLLGGLEAADSGQIMLGDFDIARARGRSLADFRNRSVGFVFQSHHLLPDLTATENVALPLLIGRTGWRESMRRVEAALERVGLEERAAHAVGQLSGGEQQRVAVARAVIKNPSLLLADEPTGNLDASAGATVGAMLVSLCREQRAAGIVATHNERLASLCDRRLLLRNGTLETERVEA